MDAFASLAVVPSASDTRGTITFTSAAPNSRVPSFSAKLQAKEFGPFLAPMTVSIVVEDGSCTYQLTGHAGGYSYDSSNNVTGLVGPDGELMQIGREMSYMASVLSQPSRQMSGRGNPGILVTDFTSAASWSVATGTPTLTQDYSGYDSNGAITGIAPRTGIASMLKMVPSSDSSEEIQNTSLTAVATSGIFGLWVYVEAQPGFEAGVGVGTGTIGVLMSTSSSSFSNALQISFIATGFREGWNFLKYNENADASHGGPGHPDGINRTLNGTGANGDIINTTVKRIKVITTTLFGATVYLDSIWTGYSTQSAIVLGSDANGTDFTTYALPLFQQYGWERKGYLAVPRRVWSSGTKVVSDWTVPKAVVDTAYAAGFEVLNHTVNHLANGALTDAGQVAYELEACRGWALGKGWLRGSNFYVSPQFSTSRLAQAVAQSLGFLMQRHARKWNIARTPWGIDNPNYIGSIDMGQASQGWQQYSTIKAAIDKCVAYGDSLWLFWHSITALGDPGTGEGTTGDDLLIYLSNFQAVLAYIASLEAAGTIDVLSPTEFYYGE